MFTARQEMYNLKQHFADWRFDTDAVKNILCTEYIGAANICQPEFYNSLYEFIRIQAFDEKRIDFMLVMQLN